jgi:hypothetical protein
MNQLMCPLKDKTGNPLSCAGLAFTDDPAGNSSNILSQIP